MYLTPFGALFPEQARAETRSMTVSAFPGVPAGDYGFIEAYCVDPRCDCRRVMLNVASRTQNRMLAAISFGFDRADEMAGPFLDPLNEQSEYAPALLDLAADVVLADPAYVARLEAHYRMVKEAAADPRHPAQVVLKLLATADAPRPKQRTQGKSRKRPRRR
jgi:hypothetical protein